MSARLALLATSATALVLLTGCSSAGGSSTVVAESASASSSISADGSSESSSPDSSSEPSDTPEPGPNMYGISAFHCQEIQNRVIPEIESATTAEPPSSLRPTGFDKMFGGSIFLDGFFSEYSSDPVVQSNLDAIVDLIKKWNEVVRTVENAGAPPTLVDQLASVAAEAQTTILPTLRNYCPE